MSHKILFLTLKVFAATGGIEKVCRVAGKAMYEMRFTYDSNVSIFCMYDRQNDADDNKYFPSEIFRGFGANKINFIRSAVQKGSACDLIILSHINLLLVGWLIKKVSPATKVILFAHGIEVWNILSNRKKMMLRCCDQFVSVSEFTNKKLQVLNGIPGSKCSVLNNCLDPFLPLAQNLPGSDDLRSRYGLKKDSLILFTLTRLSSKERYKGYDKVLEAMVLLKEKYRDIHYLVAGSYDKNEKIYLDKLIQDLDLTDKVTITGFIPEEDLVAHFAMADMYVMPSMKEGFGIVFIEAMYYGLPVIAGNIDGSIDALRNGKLGILIDPADVNAIGGAIKTVLENKTKYIPDHNYLLEQFGYETYKREFESLLMAIGDDE